ncbi:type VI secretion system protein ImpH [Devosia sp. UYZn731]|uniref:type VI secretion system baseplate subunit TssG n=1 Tax=Devosia sp. UYZn731 TaxID=3156345 RepID=UPI0033996FFB
MSRRGDIEAEPFRFDMFDVLRELERSDANRPRIGENLLRSEEVVQLGQDPFLDFPAANLSGFGPAIGAAPHLRTRFLGFFGPQGALPLSTTVEAREWSLGRDDSFIAFIDVFANRFQQLFFRAWAEARPVAQHDRPQEDRFTTYLGGFAGIGSPAHKERGSLPDIAKLPLAGLAVARTKSATRLGQMLSSLLGIKAEVIEHVGSWLQFEPDDLSKLGQRGCGLGVDAVLGERTYSLDEKFRIRIEASDLDHYSSLLPGGVGARHLADAVFFYLGFRHDYDVELCLPVEAVPEPRLGGGVKLGWTTWLPSAAAPEPGTFKADARIDLQQQP